MKPKLEDSMLAILIIAVLAITFIGKIFALRKTVMSHGKRLLKLEN